MAQKQQRGLTLEGGGGQGGGVGRALFDCTFSWCSKGPLPLPLSAPLCANATPCILCGKTFVEVGGNFGECLSALKLSFRVAPKRE